MQISKVYNEENRKMFDSLRCGLYSTLL